MSKGIEQIEQLLQELPAKPLFNKKSKNWFLKIFISDKIAKNDRGHIFIVEISYKI